MLGQNVPKAQEPTKKGKWARMVERSKKVRLNPEEIQIINEASAEIRDDFVFPHDKDDT